MQKFKTPTPKLHAKNSYIFCPLVNWPFSVRAIHSSGFIILNNLKRKFVGGMYKEQSDASIHGRIHKLVGNNNECDRNKRLEHEIDQPNDRTGVY